MGVGRFRISKNCVAGSSSARDLLSLAFAAIRFVPTMIIEPFPYVGNELEYIGVSNLFPPDESGVIPMYEILMTLHGEASDSCRGMTVTVRQGGKVVAKETIEVRRNGAEGGKE